MAVTTDNLKEYLRIDLDTEDTFLASCLAAAEAYIASAVDDYATYYDADEAFAAKADMVVTALAAEMFQNRDGRNDARQDYSFIYRSMITQLQYYVEDDDE